MRRFSCLLLALLLLLSGCAKPKEDIPASSVPSVSVKTDYSAYVPPESTPPITTYIGVSALEARDDYGALYPFVGLRLYEGMLYGLMDGQGSVVVDPVYSGVRLWEHEGEAVWYLTKTLPDENYYYSLSCTLASFDGSVVVDKDYSFAYMENGYILAGYYDENEMTVYDIYDLKLELVTTSQALCDFFPDAQGELYSLSFSDGMFLLDFYDEASENSSYYYVSLDGSSLLGPYWSGGDFAYGCASIHDGERNYYIDKEGKPLGGEYYEDFRGDGFENGVAHVSEQDYDLFGCIIDAQGNVVLDCDLASSYWITDHCIELTLNDFNLTGYYSFEGELLFPDYFPYASEGSEKYAGYFPGEWWHLGEGIFFDSQTGALYDHSTKNTYHSPLLTSSDVGSYFAEGLPYIHITHYNAAGSDNIILNKEFEELLVLNSGWLLLAEDSITKEPYFVFENETTQQVYDKDLKLLLEVSGEERSCRMVDIYNGHIIFVDEESCAGYTTDGTQFFRYTLQTNLD